MDIKEYISSGIIEAYVMGLASEEEMSILDCIQKHNPEVKQAILDAQITLEDFASKQAIAPPADLKSTIWAKIAEETEEKAVVTEKVIEPITTSLYPTQSLNQTNINLKWMAIAATILLFASVTFNFYLNKQQIGAKNEVAQLTATQKDQTLAYQNLKSKWDMSTNPGVRTIPLLGVEKHPDMKAVVYFEQNSNAVYLALENLPVAPTNQQYQLWAIVDGKPVSLGVYEQGTEIELQKMTAVASAQAFAITLEKLGGAESPTMENMYVMGKV